MRSFPDRVRHAVCFELLGLILVIPIGSRVFGFHIGDIGVIAVASATIAMIWTFVFNLGFDRAMLRLRGDTHKTPRIRVLHAVAFEAGLLMLLLPMIAWYLGIGLVQAFVMDVSFAVFYMVYAFGYNWAYDLIFPVSEKGRGPARAT